MAKAKKKAAKKKKKFKLFGIKPTSYKDWSAPIDVTKKIMEQNVSRPEGRPTDYKPEYCSQLVEHMAKGLSFECFAGTIGVVKKTLYNWCDQFPQFLHAKEIGTAKSMIFWEQIGIDHIVSRSESFGQGMGSESKSLNSSAWIFNMKNRFNWRDKIDHTHEDVPISPDTLLKKLASLKLSKEDLLAIANEQNNETTDA